MPVLWLLVAAALLAACGPLRHVPTEPRLLLAGGRASASAEGAAARAGGGERLRLAAYGDTRGDRAVHRAVVAAMVAERPDLVIFTGDALQCFPAGHLPDYGGWSYLIPLWPQYQRGYPGVALASLVKAG